jgi:hypothetical protein
VGCYLETPGKVGKAAYLREHCGAETFAARTFAAIPAGKVAVCVAENGHFDAAGVAYDEIEFSRFMRGVGGRPSTWLLVDLDVARRLAPDLDTWLSEPRR